jgi:hypothetical protein
MKSEFSNEGAGISATTGQFKRILRFYDCLMLHEHPLISAEPLEHKKRIHSRENRDMIKDLARHSHHVLAQCFFIQVSPNP